MKRIDVLELTPPDRAEDEDASFKRIECSDDGALFTLSREGEVVVVDSEQRTILRRVRLTNVGTPAFVPGTSTVEFDFHTLDARSGQVTSHGLGESARRGGSGRVRVGGIEPGRIELVSADGARTVAVAAGEVDGVRLFPDDSALLVSMDGTRLAVLDLPSGRERCVLEVPGWYSDFAASPDGRRIAVAYAALERRGLLLLDAVTGAVVYSALSGSEEQVPYADAVAFHPSGALLAVARSGHAEPLAVTGRSWLELYAPGA